MNGPIARKPPPQKKGDAGLAHLKQYREGRIAASVHFTPEAHVDFHALQIVVRQQRGGKGRFSKQALLNEALDDFFEEFGSPRHFGTDPSGPTRRQLQERVDALEAEIDALRAELASSKGDKRGTSL